MDGAGEWDGAVAPESGRNPSTVDLIMVIIRRS